MRQGDELGGLFEDLEQQAQGIELAERDAEVVDRVAGEYAQVTLASRVHASRGRPVGLVLLGGERVTGRLVDAGDGWVAVEDEARSTWLVRIAAVAVAEGLSSRATPEAARPAVARLGLGSALRRFAQDSPEMVLHLTSGPMPRVRLERVGADFVEVLRPGASAALVAFSALRAVRIG